MYIYCVIVYVPKVILGCKLKAAFQKCFMYNIGHRIKVSLFVSSFVVLFKFIHIGMLYIANIGMHYAFVYM